MPLNMKYKYISYGSKSDWKSFYRDTDRQKPRNFETKLWIPFRGQRHKWAVCHIIYWSDRAKYMYTAFHKIMMILYIINTYLVESKLSLQYMYPSCGSLISHRYRSMTWEQRYNDTGTVDNIRGIQKSMPIMPLTGRLTTCDIGNLTTCIDSILTNHNCFD